MVRDAGPDLVEHPGFKEIAELLGFWGDVGDPPEPANDAAVKEMVFLGFDEFSSLDFALGIQGKT
jgi:hypothetical protein